MYRLLYTRLSVLDPKVDSVFPHLILSHGSPQQSLPRSNIKDCRNVSVLVLASSFGVEIIILYVYVSGFNPF
jgi:hypothetical protein